MAAAIANKVYSLAREGRLPLAGFPQFSSCTDDLQKLQSMDPPAYEVCVGLPDGTLVVKETLVQYWCVTNPDFEADTKDLIDKHNERWNKNNLKRGLEGEDGAQPGQPAKRLKVDTTKPSDHEDQMEDRTPILDGKSKQEPNQPRNAT